jgi:hypothetical protein
LIESITLIAREADFTGVFTMRPDGHVSVGVKAGPHARNITRELSPDEVAATFALAARIGPAPVAPRDTFAGTVTLTLQEADRRRRQFVWPASERPSDAPLLALLEAVEALRARCSA